MTNFAPVVLFAYNRVAHVKNTIESLQKDYLASKSVLIIYCDGYKDQEDALKVLAVRNYLSSVGGFKSVKLIYGKENLGLATSIYKGVSEVMAEYGKAIVIEDDLVAEPEFLTYMNSALDKYEKEEKVMQISAYMFTGVNLHSNQAVFLRVTSSWGWATWARAWVNFINDSSILGSIEASPGLHKRFNLEGNYNYTGLWHAVIDGKLHSWAIWWYGYVFSKEGLVLYPPRSLVLNIGFDGSGTNCSVDKRLMSVEKIQENGIMLPDIIEETSLAPKIFKAIKRYYSPIFIRKIRDKVTHLLAKMLLQH